MRLLGGLFLIFSFYSFSQIGTGQWRMHVTQKGIDVAANSEVVYSVMENGLIEYDIASSEISEWTKVNGLSDINPSCIYYHQASNSFFVGYKNGNIDRIQGSTVTNIPAIRLAEFSGNKQINMFVAHEDYIYAATSFGIVLLNPSKNEVKDTYYPTADNQEIMDIAIYHDSIIALTNKRALIAAINNTALVDFQQWKNFDKLPQLNANTYKNIKNWNDQLYVLYKDDAYANDSVYEISASGLTNKIELPFGLEISKIQLINNLMYVSFTGGVFVFNQDFDLVETPLNYDYDVTGVCVSNGVVYASDQKKSLVKSSSAGVSIISHGGPPKNSFYAVSGQKNKMAFAGGTFAGATSGTYNAAGVYLFEDEQWTLIDRYNQSLWQGKFIWDILKVAISPNNSNKIAIGSYCEYPLAIVEDGKNISTIYSMSDSKLEETHVNNGMSCITDLKYDEKENLWIVNAFSKRPLKVLTKDGEWYDFNVGSNVMDQMGGKIIIDQNGLKWFNVLGRGLMVFDDNGTVEDESDDQYKQLTDSENNGALPSNTVTAIAMDYDNELWIGTTEGFGILNSTSGIMDAQPGEYNVNRIKLEYEGNVEYLLGNTYITDIEIDGGNRKWIATASSGLVLLSADGNEVIATYTTENSPIISNNIQDIHFNYMTGELFIITDLGLVSYRTDSSEGDDEYSDVKVFPNPVMNYFDGLITIQGIKYNSDVKFTDIAGNLVYQTVSNGGTAVWNGKNLKGEKVKAGTYLIWTASNTEKGRKVGKVVIIN